MTISSQPAPVLLSPVDREALSFVNGEWAGRQRLMQHRVICPFAEETIAHALLVDEATAGQALQAARDAFDRGPWSRLAPADRSAVLRRIADGLASRREALVQLMLFELGHPITLCRSAVDGAIDLWRRYADMAADYPLHEDRPVDDRRKARIVREPVGVVLAITPWNSPLFLASLKIAPAMAAGCSVVLKPAAECPLTFRHLAEVALEAGAPAGVLNILFADAAVTAAMVRDPRIDMVSFTGSTSVGTQIMQAAAHNITRVALELGGKSAAIVLDDARPEKVVRHLIGASGLPLAGQQCTARTRLLVPAAQAAAWTEAIAAAIDAIVVGDPRDAAVTLGPLATEAQRGRVERAVAAGVEEGARLVRGGKRPAGLDRGWYFEPTLFDGVDPAMHIAREEIFGPVLTLLPYRDLEEAIAIANHSDYGLAGSVFGEGMERAFEVARRVRTGTFQINTIGRATDQPFGGYRRSGLGREGGVEGYEAFLETKQIQVPIETSFTGWPVGAAA